MIFLYMGGNGGRHYSGGYSAAFGCLDVFPRAVLVEFDFGASGKIDFIFGPAAPLLLFHFADIFIGIVLCNEIAGLFGKLILFDGCAGICSGAYGRQGDKSRENNFHFCIGL